MKNIANFAVAILDSFAVGLGFGLQSISTVTTLLITITAIIATANVAIVLYENREAKR